MAIAHLFSTKSQKGKKHAKEAFKVSIKVRSGIRKKNMDYVENLLSSKKTNKILTRIEMSQLRAELAHAYFIFKNDRESIRQSRVAISLSGGQNALAYWAGGLAAGRSGDDNLSKWFLVKNRTSKNGYDDFK